jgi:hypothetical protein
MTPEQIDAYVTEQAIAYVPGMLPPDELRRVLENQNTVPGGSRKTKEKDMHTEKETNTNIQEAMGHLHEHIDKAHGVLSQLLERLVDVSAPAAPRVKQDAPPMKPMSKMATALYENMSSLDGLIRRMAEARDDLEL